MMRAVALILSLLMTAAATAQQVPTPAQRGTAMLDDPVVPVVATTPVASSGQVARSSVGQVGVRQDQGLPYVKPLARIDNRIRNRVQSRIRNRIDRTYDPQADPTASFDAASDEVREADRSIRH